MSRYQSAVRRITVLAGILLLASVGRVYAAPPIVSGVTPNRGSIAGGNAVTVTGENFSGVIDVTFNGRSASNISVVDDKTITCVTPSGNSGFAAVSVTTSDGTGTLNGAFIYGIAPTAVDDAYTVNAGGKLEIFAPGVLANDNTNGGTVMNAVLDTNASNGTLGLSSNGGFTYTPNPGFFGTDTFLYRASNINEGGPGNAATVTIEVAGSASPQPPAGFYVSAMSGNAVTFRWTKPATGLTPTDFSVEGGNNPSEVLAAFAAGPNPILTVTLPNGSFYFRVHTIAGAERSAASNEIRVFVNVPVPPSAPENFLGMANGSSLALAWKNTFGGGSIGTVVLDVIGSITTSIALGVTDTFSFAGVPPGTYTLTLRATNAAGSSAASNPVTLTFPSPCSGAPLAPSNFLAFKVGTTIFVLWDPPVAGPAPTSYLLIVGGSFVGSFPTTGRILSGGVGPGSYDLSVVAINACGSSPATPGQTVVIP